ncbi:uncharacterized protein ACB058_003215 isoform 1-T2 [Synchiropus picturatus]
MAEKENIDNTEEGIPTLRRKSSSFWKRNPLKARPHETSTPAANKEPQLSSNDSFILALARAAMTFMNIRRRDTTAPDLEEAELKAEHLTEPESREAVLKKVEGNVEDSLSSKEVKSSSRKQKAKQKLKKSLIGRKRKMKSPVANELSEITTPLLTTTEEKEESKEQAAGVKVIKRKDSGVIKIELTEALEDDLMKSKCYSKTEVREEKTKKSKKSLKGAGKKVKILAKLFKSHFPESSSRGAEESASSDDSFSIATKIMEKVETLMNDDALNDVIKAEQLTSKSEKKETDTATARKKKSLSMYFPKMGRIQIIEKRKKKEVNNELHLSKQSVIIIKSPDSD